jgi:hypothetical protein
LLHLMTPEEPSMESTEEEPWPTTFNGTSFTGY